MVNQISKNQLEKKKPSNKAADSNETSFRSERPLVERPRWEPRRKLATPPCCTKKIEWESGQKPKKSKWFFLTIGSYSSSGMTTSMAGETPLLWITSFLGILFNLKRNASMCLFGRQDIGLQIKYTCRKRSHQRRIAYLFHSGTLRKW